MLNDQSEARPYETLRKEILSLDLMPGEPLTERGLEGRVGASRTPIRAALFRLENEGLTQRHGRGWRVSPIDLTEIRALAEYREAAETVVVRLVIERASDDDLDLLHHLVEGLTEDPDEISGERGLGAGTDFHLVLAQLSGNPFLAAAIADVMTRLTRTRYLEVRTPESRAQARHEHEQIAAAISARNTDLATTLVLAHGRDTIGRLLDVLKEERRKLRGRGFSIIES